MTSLDLFKVLFRVWNNRSNKKTRFLIIEASSNEDKDGLIIDFNTNMNDESIIIIMEQHTNRIKLTNPSAFDILKDEGNDNSSNS